MPSLLSNITGGGSGLNELTGAEQYGRKINLLVEDLTNLQAANVPVGSEVLDDAIDLSELRIKFSIKVSDTQTPNTADIRVYNLATETAQHIKSLENKSRVILQAGYEANFGVIFQGNIKQVILGRESATDTFIDIIAGDGDRAYNFAVVNATIAKGSTQLDQVNAAVTAMTPKGVTAGHIGDMPTNVLPRGKSMYGNARNYLRDVAQSTDKTWSIQNEKVTFIPLKSYLPGEAVVLTSGTGMIGTPQQTNTGVNIKCLLNPLIKIGGLVKIDNKSIQLQKLSIDQIAAAKGDVHAINNLIPRRLNEDGNYYVLTMELTGDTRGIDWYSSLICLSTDVSANPANAVTGGF